jgi:hypothetical protein
MFYLEEKEQEQIQHERILTKRTTNKSKKTKKKRFYFLRGLFYNSGFGFYIFSDKKTCSCVRLASGIENSPGCWVSNLLE